MTISTSTSITETSEKKADPVVFPPESRKITGYPPAVYQGKRGYLSIAADFVL